MLISELTGVAPSRLLGNSDDHLDSLLEWLSE